MLRSYNGTAAVVATLLSILYHLIREKKIDTFRICGMKVPICRDGKIELTSLQVIWSRARELASMRIVFGNRHRAGTWCRSRSLLTQKHFGMLLAGYCCDENRGGRDEVKGGRRVASAGYWFREGHYATTIMDILFIPTTRSLNDYSICELSCVQLFLHAGRFPCLFSHHVRCTTTPGFFFPIARYSSSPFPQSNQCRLSCETSVEKRGRESFTRTFIIL